MALNFWADKEIPIKIEKRLKRWSAAELNVQIVAFFVIMTQIVVSIILQTSNIGPSIEIMPIYKMCDKFRDFFAKINAIFGHHLRTTV